MATLIEIKDAIDRIGVAHEEFKKVNDERIKAVEAGNESRAAELGEKLAKIEKEISGLSALKKSIEDEMELQRDRIEELESRAKSPGKTHIEKLKDEYKATFVDWMRNKGMSPLHEQKMQELSKKDITIGSPAGGGYAVPEEIARAIERLEKKFSPVRGLVKVVQTGSSDYKELVNIRGTTSGWVGETPSPARGKTETSQLREVTPTHGELYAYPQASEWSLDDLFFNVEDWLAEEVAQEFALQEGDAVIRGNGTSKPTGMLNTTPTSADDFASPLRAAAVYQFIACLTSLSPAVAELRGDPIIDLVYTLNSAYRSGASFIANSATIGAMRKLKNTQGDYLWQPALQLAQPDMLLGYPVVTWEQMDDIGTNKFPIGFGNWRRAYVLTDRVGLRVTRDNITNIGFVRFYVRRREGGIVLNNDAAKFLRTTIA